MSRITQQNLKSYLWGTAVLLRGTVDAGDSEQSAQDRTTNLIPSRTNLGCRQLSLHPKSEEPQEASPVAPGRPQTPAPRGKLLPTDQTSPPRWHSLREAFTPFPWLRPTRGNPRLDQVQHLKTRPNLVQFPIQADDLHGQRVQRRQIGRLDALPLVVRHAGYNDTTQL